MYFLCESNIVPVSSSSDTLLKFKGDFFAAIPPSMISSNSEAPLFAGCAKDDAINPKLLPGKGASIRDSKSTSSLPVLPLYIFAANRLVRGEDISCLQRSVSSG